MEAAAFQRRATTGNHVALATEQFNAAACAAYPLQSIILNHAATAEQ